MSLCWLVKLLTQLIVSVPVLSVAEIINTSFSEDILINFESIGSIEDLHSKNDTFDVLSSFK